MSRRPGQSAISPTDRGRQFYALGVRGKKETSAGRSGAKSRAVGNRRNLGAFAEDEGISPGHAHNAIRFAELYNRAAFAALCRQICSAARPLGVGHICELIQVAVARPRQQLLKETLKHGWSVRQLQRIRVERFGQVKPDRQRGRRPQAPVSVEDAYGQLSTKAQQLKRVLEVTVSVDISISVRKQGTLSLRAIEALLAALRKDRLKRRK